MKVMKEKKNFVFFFCVRFENKTGDAKKKSMTWMIFLVYSLLCLLVLGLVCTSRYPNARIQSRSFPVEVVGQKRVVSLRVWIAENTRPRDLDGFFQSFEQYTPPPETSLRIVLVANDHGQLTYRVRQRIVEWQSRILMVTESLVSYNERLSWSWKDEDPDRFFKTLVRLPLDRGCTTHYVAWLTLHRDNSQRLDELVRALEENRGDIVSHKHTAVAMTTETMKRLSASENDSLAEVSPLERLRRVYI